MFYIQFLIWLSVSYIVNGDNFDDTNLGDDKMERSCYENPFYMNPSCFFKLNYNPLRYYLIRKETNGNLYYLPEISQMYCDDIEHRYRKFPLVLSSRRYGIRLIRSYQDLLKNHCIDEDSSGKYYFVPSEDENHVNRLKENIEHDFLNNYCKEHYRNIDFSDPSSDGEKIYVSFHLPDINSRLMKPYKIPINIKRDVNVESPDQPNLNDRETHQIFKKQLHLSNSKRMIGCPHSKNEEPCAECGGSSDFLDKIDNCDICDDQKVEPICSTERVIIHEFTQQECDNNKENFRTENDLIAWQGRVRLQDPETDKVSADEDSNYDKFDT